MADILEGGKLPVQDAALVIIVEQRLFYHEAADNSHPLFPPERQLQIGPGKPAFRNPFFRPPFQFQSRAKPGSEDVLEGVAGYQCRRPGRVCFFIF